MGWYVLLPAPWPVLRAARPSMCACRRRAPPAACTAACPSAAACSPPPRAPDPPPCRPPAPPEASYLGHYIQIRFLRALTKPTKHLIRLSYYFILWVRNLEPRFSNGSASNSKSTFECKPPHTHIPPHTGTVTDCDCSIAHKTKGWQVILHGFLLAR
eukprot:515497-Pyramimonas_sp.AAC.1